MQLAKLARRGAGVFASVAVGFSALAAATPAQAQPFDDSYAKPGYIAQAYGSYIFTEDKKLANGPTAYADIACGAAPGTVETNKTKQVVLPNMLGHVGVQQTYVEAAEHGDTRTSIANSRTAGLSLLGGLITGGAIKSETRVIWDGTRMRAEQSSSIADLRVLGVRVAADPAPNTKIDLTLPLLGQIGYVELNRQYRAPAEGGGYEAITTAFHLVLLSNNPWLPGQGLHVWAGNSKAALTKPTVGFLKGQAFATRITLADGVVSSGPTSLAKVSCVGGRSTNSVATVQAEDAAKAGVAKSDAIGEVTAEGTTSKVANRIAAVEALGGLIRVDSLVAAATATRKGNGPIVLSDSGTRFVGLEIAGRRFHETEHIAPNTKISVLNGAVEVTLHKVRQDARTIEVTMIELLIKDDAFGLPVGSKVEIGRAYAGITPTD